MSTENTINQDTIDWDKIDIEALDDKKVEFFYNNAIQLVNNIRKTSDTHRQKSGLYLTGCILLLTIIIPLVIQIIPSISKITYTIFKENTTCLFIFVVLLIIPGILVVFIIITGFWKAIKQFHITLRNKCYITPYLPPRSFFENEVYKKEMKEIKIDTIQLLENEIISENFIILEKNTKSLEKGIKYFAKAFYLLIISPIIFSVLITILLVLLQIYNPQLLYTIFYSH